MGLLAPWLDIWLMRSQAWHLQLTKKVSYVYRYKGIQYHTCTSVDDPVGPWCATQVSPNGNKDLKLEKSMFLIKVDAHGDYMPDFWGRCECPEALNTTASGGRRG
jgi:hypothetical protein